MSVSSVSVSDHPVAVATRQSLASPSSRIPHRHNLLTAPNWYLWLVGDPASDSRAFATMMRFEQATRTIRAEPRWEGRVTEVLGELFSSKVRAAVLSQILPRPHLGFSLTEMSHLLNLPISSLQHECYKLVRLGILRDARAGNARLYWPDLTHALILPLTSLVLADLGPDRALRAAVEGMPRLERAFFVGDLTDRPALDPWPRPSSPALLVLIGDLTLEDVDAATARVARVVDPLLGPDRVEPAYFRPVDWDARQAAGSGVIANLLAGTVLTLAGPPLD